MPSIAPARPAAGPTTAEPSLDLLDLSVIIVNYNVRAFLEQALSSVERACEGLVAEVFVVDNNSVDGSVEMVRERFPDVEVIANETNVGFGRANNQAIRRARGRYLLILNPDTIVQEDTFHTLVRFMEAHPDAGALGCKILNPDGTFAPESRRTFPMPAVAFYRVTGLSRLFPRSRIFGRYNLTYLPQDEVTEVDALSGSCMLVRRAALYVSHARAETLRADGLDPARQAPAGGDGLAAGFDGAGLFDEDFFMYGEDLDWCYRIQEAGWRIYYTPETQIIHYKGECTKQGELRYVRLFYGAMLQFTDKHFHGRYSRLFAHLLRVGIVLRAGLSVIGNTLRRWQDPILELLVVLALMARAGAFSAARAGKTFAPLFYQAVVPAYALLTIGCIAAVGGYRRYRRRIRPALTGVGAAFLIVAAASFLFKDIAFSRAAVRRGFGASAGALAGLRRLRRDRRRGPKRALLVGRDAEVRRLQGQLLRRPGATFRLVGYVPPEEELADRPVRSGGVPRLGARRQLRDLVRVRRIDEVVFAAADMSNQTMFHLIQQLRDLPVQFKILANEGDHIIGKASIEDLTTLSLIEAEATLRGLRSPLARRVFEVPMALLGLLLHLPVVAVDRLGGGARPGWRRLRAATAQAADVLLGARALVGYDPDGPARPPEEWGLKPGVFSITEVRAGGDADAEEAYWFYAEHQSALLDLDLIVRALRSAA